MRSAPCRRWAALVVTFAAAISACSLLVPTDGLTDVGGDAGPTDSGATTSTHDAAGPRDAGGVPEAGATLDDASEASAAPPTDAGDDAPTDKHDAARDAGVNDGDAASPLCGGDLSNIGVGDFHVSMILRTTQSGRAALVNQRTTCGAGMFWDLRLSSGALQIETEDASSYASFTSTGPALNDGAPHVVLVTRVGETLTVSVDGTDCGSGASKASFGALAPLASGIDVCDANDGTVAFQGTISSLCVTNH